MLHGGSLGQTHRRLKRRWRIQHSEMVLQLPGVGGYTQNHVVAQATDDARANAIDGFAEICFENEESMKAALETRLWGAIVDEANAFLGTVSGYVIDEHVLRETTRNEQ
jgi:uncharacterized protein (TIGR02118 family)